MKIIFLLLLLSLSSCQPLERISPFTEQTTTKDFALNLRVHELPPSSGSFSIAVMSDSHQDYDDLQKTVDVINGFNPNFIVHTGDFTNQGYNFEYDFFVDRMRKLNAPYVVTIGNHDTLTNGKEIYQRIFGPFNMVFRVYGYKFIVFNNNSLDFKSDGGINFPWLKTVIQNDSLPTVILMHVNPDSKDYFTVEEQAELMSIFNIPQVKLILHGHNHRFQTTNLGTKVIHMTSRVKEIKWSRVDFTPNSFQIYNCQQSECTNEANLNY